MATKAGDLKATNNVEDNKARIAARFVWGDILQVLNIGDYYLVEFDPKDDELAYPMYHAYYKDGQTLHNTQQGHDSIEEALIVAIARRFDGRHTKSDKVFLFSIGLLTSS